MFCFPSRRNHLLMTQSSVQTQPDIESLNAQVADLDATAFVQWSAEMFPTGLVMTSSFGAQSAVMLHLVTRVVPDVPVILIDTGYLFPDTYRFVQAMTDRLELNLKVYRPQMTNGWLEALHGPLWARGPAELERYHQIVKVEPMQRALEELEVTAWLAGLRSEQTGYRSGLRRIEMQGDRYKLHPILDWSTRDVHEYLKAHNLPYHPLYEKGYKSIGDVHSTLPITAGQDERAGRFGGKAQECGLHLPTSADEQQSRDSSGL